MEEPAPIDAAAFAPDGIHVAIGDWDGNATIWNLQTGARTRIPQGEYVHAVAYDSQANVSPPAAATAASLIYRVVDGELLAKLPGTKMRS